MIILVVPGPGQIQNMAHENKNRLPATISFERNVSFRGVGGVYWVSENKTREDTLNSCELKRFQGEYIETYSAFW